MPYFDDFQALCIYVTLNVKYGKIWSVSNVKRLAWKTFMGVEK